ncbi:hypothetical protein [Streptomyces sp. enrichment culture]|uniref:hypothetical protein n=1 Tax=Streptomyces sp. enrichment culture TaxID=1795815 RepID=UPI003F56B129
MTGLLLLTLVLVVFAVPSALAWLLGRRLGIPGGMLAVWVAAGWVVVILGGVLSQRAQPVLFPDTSPCHGAGVPVSQYFPPDSFCRHDDGELRTVNGPAGKLVFWLACGTVLAVPGAALLRRRRAHP